MVGLTGAMVARADSLSVDFEAPTYTTGSINGQDGWSGQACPIAIPINPAVDQAVVANGIGAPASFGAQSWRMSNAYTDGAFAGWPFSKSLTDEAGEFPAENGGCSGGTRQSYFEASWDFTSTVPGAEQPGLQMSAAPDRGDGARMSFVRFRDLPAGLEVTFVDYQSGVNESGCILGTNFVETTIGAGLSRAVAHNIRLTMQFYPGPNNDVVKVYLDGSLEHTGTSWEGYFNECEGNPTRTVDSVIFQARSGGGTAPLTLGKGFLIDNLTLISSNPTCDNVIMGTSGPDIITGTNKNDCIDGGGGDDTISGGNGKDVIMGGQGNDTIYGGNGGDTILGGDGNDTLYGDNAKDGVSGNGGNDYIDGGNGADTVDGGSGTDTCVAGVGDVLVGCEL